MDHRDGNQPDTPPTADTGFKADRDGTRFIPGGRPVPVGNGISWLFDAWGLFKRQAGLWIGFILCYAAMFFLSRRIPLGSVILAFVQFLLVAGVIHSCDLLRRKGAFVFGDLFAAFQRNTGPLLIACLICSGFLLVVTFIVGLFGGSAVLAMASGDPSVSVGMGTIIGLLIFGGGSLVIYVMMVWFTPALIMLHDIAPVEAIKMSFFACRKNLLPGIVFFIILTVLVTISSIPALLGLLITMPIALICYYTSYCDIFLDKGN